MDSVDIKILDILQVEGRITMKELGLRVGLTSPATIERVKKLEESGIIDGYKAIVNSKQAGLPIRAFLLVTAADPGSATFCDFVRGHHSILQGHRVAGGNSHLLEVAVVDLTAMELLLDEIAQQGLVEPLLVLSTPAENKPVILPRQGQTK